MVSDIRASSGIFSGIMGLGITLFTVISATALAKEENEHTEKIMCCPKLR
jgi:hypothetical protein